MKRLLLVLILLFMGVPAAAQTGERYCWVDVTLDSALAKSAVTRCRSAGEIVDYANENRVPGRLYPAVGTAGNGTCWYWRSAPSGWVFITRNADGTAVFAYDPDADPGGPLVVDVVYPVCTSEPAPVEPDILLAWDLASEYVHVEPDPDLNPRVPWGLTGAETHLRVVPPPPFSDSIVDPLGQVVEVNGRVIGVTINWGDGAVASFTEGQFSQLSGYPDGLARHVYEVKTCSPPGSTPRCHPSLTSYPMTVDYIWEVSWRAGGAPFASLAIPNTTTSVAYPVREIIAVLDVRP
jgi:hypothetical protein